MSRVLIVDDEGNIRRMVAALLEAEGYETSAAADAEEAIDRMERGDADAVLLDLALPRMDGLTLLETLRARWPAVPVVMMSGRATLADAVRATRTGAFHFLEKPLQPEALLLALEGAIELRRARELTRALHAELRAGDTLVGSSAAMQRIRELIRQIAPTDARVLITGESGTGKELVASALHAASARAGGPFVRVNCAAIPRELVESEMFGHERGAFTGATETRRGRFELAHRGTLLLDEVADLSEEAQAKLLRVLEAGAIERLGSERAVTVDVRVIAATNRDLAQTLRTGRLRPDLYYRLNVLHIALPPLRDRAADIPELAAHFMERLRARDGLVPPVLADSALERMCAYSWPGNVRELANLCERLAILLAGATVQGADLNALLVERAATLDEDRSQALADRLDAYERRVIERSLYDAGGSITEAAKELHTDRPNLYRRMRRLGIER
jgi:two-component system nitrogen regulation response regulator NtrX